MKMETVKTVVITGGGGHLGRAVARWWAKRGAQLVLVDRDRGKLEASRAELADATIIAADITAQDDLKAAIAALPETLWQEPPSLVMTHGLSGKEPDAGGLRLGELNRAAWQRVLDANLDSFVFAIETFLPIMKRAGGGRIVLVSSAAGLSASPTAALSYSVSKAGVAALPRILSRELAASRVLINAVAPGKFVNPDWPDDPEKLARYEASIPLGRIASAEEVAELIGFLSSGANSYLTGQTILQDGGRL
jgi:NAD(P)-dependent dehydrogenase (short-subunit alcohol dehydrogenase family)